MTEKTNILLVTVDQMRFDHLGLTGVQGIETPHLDKMGLDGVHFNRAYTCSPVCTPARVSLLTGKYPSSHGAYSIGVTADPFPEITLPGLLKEQNYNTGLVGKAHFVSRIDEESHITQGHNVTNNFYGNFNGPYAGFDYIQLSSHHTINGKPEWHYKAWLEEQGVDYSKWFPDTTGIHEHAQTGVWNIPEKYHDTTWITQKTEEFIQEKSKEENPWFIWASYNDPHEPFVCPEPWYSSVHSSEIQAFEGYRKGEFDNKPSFYQSVFDNEHADGGWPETFLDETKIDIPCAYGRSDLKGKEKEALQATLGMVAMIDHQIGKIFQTLENTKQLDNTLVIFTSDHGEIHGHHGLWHKGLFAYEDCQRVPLIIWGSSELVHKHSSIETLASLVDLPRTILDYANAPQTQGIQGISLKPFLQNDKDAITRKHTIVELRATKNIYQQTFITNQYKLVIYEQETYGELYDLLDDPNQYNNLWDIEEFQKLKTELMQQMIQARMKEEGYVHFRNSFA